MARGQTNGVDEHTSRTIGEIARANIVTRFNAILGAMFVLIVITGEYRDALFAIVLVANAAIGIYQEWKAKRVLDRLAVLSAPRAHAIRNGAPVELMVDEVVLDDLLELRTGDQVPCDGVVQHADGLEVDESLLTGESDAIAKRPDDDVMSGSIVVAGNGRIVATAVGADAYARKLATEARRFTLVRSELQSGIDQIVRYVTYALGPVVLLLFWSQLRAGAGWREALQGIVAGVVAMVPEGLVLLTSLTFMLAAISLARRNVLVQELPAVEGLARVDVVCVDKTGTITEGIIEYGGMETLGGTDEALVREALGALGADEHGNATMQAIGEVMAAPDGWPRDGAVPFSSARKWSGMSFGGRGTWVTGAPEMIDVQGDQDAVRARAAELAAEGLRVLLVAQGRSAFDGEQLPTDLEARALVTLTERVRPDAPETFAYFGAQGVQLRVMSGDNPQTVGAVARRAGIPWAEHVFDARELPDDDAALADLLETNTVFGRVTPQQKRAMVRALQSRGHVVAMTGDGVNDALALKDADIGIAMGNGAVATRSVAQLVLLDGKFATMPGVVAEGRRVIANVERVSNLYVTKTVYATLIALFIGLTAIGGGWPYPFLPRHLTVVSTLAIGVPSFFLALEANTRRYVRGFVARVLRFTLPSGAIIAAGTLTTYGIVRTIDGVSLAQQRTSATIVLLVAILWCSYCLPGPSTGTGRCSSRRWVRRSCSRSRSVRSAASTSCACRRPRRRAWPSRSCRSWSSPGSRSAGDGSRIRARDRVLRHRRDRCRRPRRGEAPELLGRPDRHVRRAEHADPDDVERASEHVLAVTRRLHPRVVEHTGGRAGPARVADVLADLVEAPAEQRVQVGVRELAVAAEARRPHRRGSGELGVPAQRREPAGGPLRVEPHEQIGRGEHRGRRHRRRRLRGHRRRRRAQARRECAQPEALRCAARRVARPAAVEGGRGGRDRERGHDEDRRERPALAHTRGRRRAGSAP